MTRQQSIAIDSVCWISLIAAVWTGPMWITKFAVSIMCVWNMACIIYLKNNT